MSVVGQSGALGEYRTTDAYGAAASVDRLELITRMMQGAVDRIATARGHMSRGEAAEKGEQIGKAIGLIDGLRACLDDTGDCHDIATNLDSLYSYMLNQLMQASLENNDATLAEVTDLLNEIKTGWEMMVEQYRPEMPHETSRETGESESVVSA